MITKTDVELPLFLAGPIVRRSEASRIWIWICSSKNLSLEGFTFEDASDEMICTGGGKAITIMAGQCCFVHLIELRPKKFTFPQQKRIYYDIRVSTTNNASIAFSGWSLEQWIPIRSITKGAPNEKLPSVTLNNSEVSKDNPLRGFFSSCRMAGGGGEDSMLIAQELWSAQFTKESKDQSSVFHLNLMIGDQIYADNVDPDVSLLVRTLAPLIIGRNEVVGVERLGKVTTDSSPAHRTSILQSLGFSGKLKYHCVLFGEYVALYCLCFATEALDKYFAQPRLPFSLRNTGVGTTRQESYARERFRSWFAGKEALRTIFANVPTYFQLDDHEVTDDWNLNQDWINKTKNDGANRIFSHAVSAFFLFQGWGNTPESFNSYCAVISDELEKYANNARNDAPFPNLPILKNKPYWGYETPTVPAFHVLDTRTHRENKHVTSLRLTQFKYGFEWQNEIKQSAYALDDPRRLDESDTTRVLLLPFKPIEKLENALFKSKKEYKKLGIVVSPCAVFSADASRNASRLFGRETADAEDWDSSHPSSMKRLLELLKGFETLVFLSGDIHYGYHSTGTVTMYGKSTSIVEAVSSPSLNRSLLPWFGTSFEYSTEIARWYEKTDETRVKSAYGNAIYYAKRELRTEPDIYIKTRRTINVYRNNIGIIELIGEGAKIKISS